MCLTEKKLHLVIRTQFTHQKQAIKKYFQLCVQYESMLAKRPKSHQKFIDDFFQIGPFVPGIVRQSWSPVVAERLVLFVVEELEN
jgi:hypothetical protein